MYDVFASFDVITASPGMFEKLMLFDAEESIEELMLKTSVGISIVKVPEVNVQLPSATVTSNLYFCVMVIPPYTIVF